jgi:ketosteroid isomerase-like protein
MANPGVASMAADLVRLRYHYLDIGDVDSYGSLLHEDTVLERPGSWPIRGRRNLERHERCWQRGASKRHWLAGLAVDGELVVVSGRVEWRRRSDHFGHYFDFVDLFELCREGLIIRSRTLALISVKGC